MGNGYAGSIVHTMHLKDPWLTGWLFLCHHILAWESKPSEDYKRRPDLPGCFEALFFNILS